MHRMIGVAVRPGTSADLTALTDIYNHYVINSPVTFDTEPVTISARAQWLSHYAKSGPYRVFVAEAEGVVVGYATSGQFRGKQAYATSIETSVYCRPGFSGLGIGSQLYTALFEAVRDEDLHRAYAGITIPNAASEAIHRRFGFTDLGVYHAVGRKLGRYWDVLWTEKKLPTDG